MGLTKGSVSIALNGLRRRQLIADEEDSKFFCLTEEGHREVHHILSSRTLLYYFLRDFLKVDEELSHKDSCLMEHLMSSETREKLFEFMKILSSEGREGEELDIKSGLDFSRYEDYASFLEDQKGDTYLSE